MNKSSIFRSILVVTTTLFLFASCDKDFNEIGSDVIGDDHFDFLPDSLSTVVAFNQPTGILQTNNMAINSLGIYNNPFFGKTKANFVTDLQMSSVNPTFDLEKFIELDSVVLTIPYFSKRTKTNANGSGEYKLDSIYGSGPINLKIFESGYVLNDLDPDEEFQSAQKYFSDEDSNFEDNKKVLLYENTGFVPDGKEFVTFTKDKGLVRDPEVAENVEGRFSPRMRLLLNKEFFKSKIIHAPAGKLVNNSVFKEYFKGLYFQVQDAESGTLMQLKFTDGDITLHYKEYSALEDADNNPDTPKTAVKFPEDDPEYAGVAKKTAKTFVIKMAGNTVNLFKNDPTAAYLAGIGSPNTTLGDPRLYLKGGSEGSLAIIDLFGPDTDNNDIADELEIIKGKQWLINEANLVFYIDNSEAGMGKLLNDKKASEPRRVYLYDLDNKRPLFDYYKDVTAISGAPKYNKYVHDGLIQTEEVADAHGHKKGIKYRVRITNHIRNLVRKDSTNVRIGLVVTESIENIANAGLKATVNGVDRIPQASVMNPLGTVLYGTNIPFSEEPNSDYAKRLKLEIYYTKPN